MILWSLDKDLDLFCGTIEIFKIVSFLKFKWLFFTYKLVFSDLFIFKIKCR